MIESTLFEPASPIPYLDRIQMVGLGGAKASDCELDLQFGLFFDGTDNNHERDKAKFADTNIARLWRSYPIHLARGVATQYIPGVGTEFGEMDSEAEGWRGTAFGIGCEARVLFALLKTLEFVRLFVDPRKTPFSKAQLRVLCQNSIVNSPNKEKILAELGLARGLQELGDDRGRPRQEFFRREAKKLEIMMNGSPVKITNLVIDIFGFSRGAAEARAYATWLCESLVGGKFAGIPLTIRFMGLYDTVASAGVLEMVRSAINNSTGGHSGWARPESLRIPPQAKNCVHFVAMHEIRKNFPVDSIFDGSHRPQNLIEIAYPGSHSDVGGGYSPGELGIAAGLPPQIGDSMKLSQITLNHLFQYAVAAGVPLDKKSAGSRRSNYDPFAISEKLEEDFRAFQSITGQRRSTIADWATVYLAWRWHVRNRYHEIGHVRNARADQALLLEANRKLIDDATQLLQPPVSNSSIRVVKDFVFARGRSGLQPPTSAYAMNTLEKEAGEVLRKAIAFGMPDPRIVDFFDRYVHDSYAGFCANLTEPTGYWRYRRGFQGSEKPMHADLGGGAGAQYIA